MLRTHHHLSVRLFLFAFTLLTAQHSMHAQTANSIVAATTLRSAARRDDSILARRAVASLEQLKAAVVVYSSYDTFESDGRLARVPLETFADKLNQVTAEVESIISQLSGAKLRSELSNSLSSYRDGAFWWAKLNPEKVVKIADLRAGLTTITPAERFFTSTIPYRVVMHWRQANKYLLRAQRLVAEANTPTPLHTYRSLSERDDKGQMR
jgi:hypothetical protein